MKTSVKVEVYGEQLDIIRYRFKAAGERLSLSNDIDKNYEALSKSIDMETKGTKLIISVGEILMNTICCKLPPGDNVTLELTADNGLTD